MFKDRTLENEGFMIETVYYLLLKVISFQKKKNYDLGVIAPQQIFFLSFLDLWYLKPKISPVDV